MTIKNNPNLTDPNIPAAISTNRTALTSVGETLDLYYDAPGMNVSYDNSYQTAVGANVTDLTPNGNWTCNFISQLNVTTSPFTSTGENCGSCQIPGGYVLGNDPIVNGTIFVAISTQNVYVTPYNLSILNDIIVAGPAVLIAG